MNPDYQQAPIDPELGMASPHLVDYWRVITRRLWLVLLIFGVTTSAAIWAVSRQTEYFDTSLLLQVNDPLERSRQLTSPGLRLGTQIFVDPIESEIQVLRSQQVALEVVSALGLQLRPTPASGLQRSALFHDSYVSPEAPLGSWRLQYDDSGAAAVLLAPSGMEVGSANAGETLDAGVVRFTLQMAPSDNRSYPLEIVSPNSVTGEISGALAGTSRENTNLIDVQFRAQDQYFAPLILNEAAAALQQIGAGKVRQQAEAVLEFTQLQLDSARAEFRNSAGQLRRFQETAAFTDLDSEQRRVIQRIQTIQDRIAELEREESALQNLRADLAGVGINSVDLVAFLAQLPRNVNPQLTSLVDDIQRRKDDMQRMITVEGMTANHPEVEGVQAQITSRESELAAAVNENLDVIESEIEDQNATLNLVIREQANLPQLRNQLDELAVDQEGHRETVRFLNGQLYQAKILASSAEPYVDVVDPAVFASPTRVRGRTNLILGALLGLILGVGAAFFLEYLDRTVRTSSDVETLLGIPVLGIIPRLRRLDDPIEDQYGIGVPMLVAMDPLDPAAEAYRNLRMNLMFMSTDEDPIKTILFSSPGPHEGKSTSALNFAVMLAQQGQRVLLIDADLRRPSIHKSLDLLREPGLTNLLVSDSDPREAIRPNVLPNLDVLPSGPFPPNPSELLNSKAMARLLEEFEGRYSHIIVDTPPVLAVTDAALVGSSCDGVVLVLRSGETEQRAAERAVDQLRRVGVRVFGAVLNEVSTSTTEESYYLQYYYSYHPREKKGLSRLREGLAKTRFW